MGYENSGRRPAPTALTVLRGNPGKKKLNENEVRPPAGEVVKPAGLSEGAGVVWDELAPICLAMRTLTVADIRPFASLCELQATMQATSAMKDGRALFALKVEDEEDPASLTVSIDAVLRLERETANALRPYYELFGLTPVARARIVVPKTKAEEPESKWAGALK
jgi:phage terminase small subunit